MQSYAQEARWFVELLQHPELTRRDVFVYGVILATEKESQPPSLEQLAGLAGVLVCEFKRSLAKLRRAKLIATVERTRTRARYAALGPCWCCDGSGESPPSEASLSRAS